MKQRSIARFLNNYVFSFLGIKIEKIERTFEGRRSKLIHLIKPDLVIDGGANIGQWAKEVRKTDPSLEIWSYEPLQESRNRLERASQQYSNKWKIFPYALGKKNEKRTMNVASNSQMSSSLLNSNIHSAIHPEITFSNRQTVEVITLDSLQKDLDNFKNIFLKLDIQGFEMAAILGALKILPKVSIVELESSFSPLYEGETPHHELISKMKSLGFTVWCTSTPSTELSGRQFALDTLLIREDLIAEHDL